MGTDKWTNKQMYMCTNKSPLTKEEEVTHGTVINHIRFHDNFDLMEMGKKMPGKRTDRSTGVD